MAYELTIAHLEQEVHDLQRLLESARTELLNYEQGLENARSRVAEREAAIADYTAAIEALR